MKKSNKVYKVSPLKYHSEFLLSYLDPWINQHTHIPKPEDFKLPSYKSYQNAFGRWNTALEILGYGKNRGYRKNYGRYTGKYINSSGYRFIYKPEHPKTDKDGYVLEHILVMEKAIGRYLEKDELIHHLDGNRANNSINNLCLMSHSSHSSWHMYCYHWERRQKRV